MKKILDIPLHWQILFGMISGLVVGVLLNLNPVDLGGFGAFVVKLNNFIGDLFIRSLRFIAVPIVLFSLIAGAGGLNSTSKLGRIGLKTLVIYVGTTAVAITVGLLLANLFQPGLHVSESIRDALASEGAQVATNKMKSAQPPDVWATFLNMVPKNPFKALAEGQMLQIVFFSLAVGLGLNLLAPEKSRPILQICDSMTQVMIGLVQLLMKTAPVAVFALIVEVTAQMGLDVLGALFAYCLVVIGGLAVMVFVLYPSLLVLFGPGNVRRFFSGIFPAQMLAFSSSSSSATMPVTMECVEKNLGVREDVTSFVIPLGATVNMDGTALYQGVAAIFIAQLYSFDLSFADQLTIILTATLASIGTAGVPGVGLIMLVIVLQSVGMPTTIMTGGIAIIFGVDRILDMCRTVCNVTGDCMVASVVSHGEQSRSEAAPVMDTSG